MNTDYDYFTLNNVLEYSCMICMKYIRNYIGIMLKFKHLCMYTVL